MMRARIPGLAAAKRQRGRVPQVFPGNAPAYAPVSTGKLGMNPNFVANWSPGQAFIDIMRTCQRWPDDAAHDANGWLVETGQYFVFVNLDAAQDDLDGRYRLWWDGNAQNVSVGGTNVDASVPNQIEFDYANPGDGTLIIDVYNPDPAPNNVRNMRMVRLDHLAAYNAGERFRPAWKQRVDGLKILRFMDWQMTNGSSIVDYSDRATLQSHSWVAQGGPPIEVMIELCNEIGADPWINLPHLCTNAYVSTVATLVRDTLNPALTCYFELSNEPWNFGPGFSQSTYFRDQARAEGWTDGDWMQACGKRSTQCMQIISSVFSGEINRIVRVAPGQLGWTTPAITFLDAPLSVDQGNDPPYQWHDMLAVTGYFDGGLNSQAAWDTILPLYASDPASAWQYMHDAVRDSMDSKKAQWADHETVAQDRGLYLGMYEGGTHIVPFAYADEATHDNAIAINTEFHQTGYCGENYNQLLAAWEDSPHARGPFVKFNLTSKQPDTQNGYTWGALQYPGQQPEPPRWDALMAYNNGDPAPVFVGGT